MLNSVCQRTELPEAVSASVNFSRQDPTDYTSNTSVMAYFTSPDYRDSKILVVSEMSGCDHYMLDLDFLLMSLVDSGGAITLTDVHSISLSGNNLSILNTAENLKAIRRNSYCPSPLM